jgi:hypothetical protein
MALGLTAHELLQSLFILVLDLRGSNFAVGKPREANAEIRVNWEAWKD